MEGSDSSIEEEESGGRSTGGYAKDTRKSSFRGYYEWGKSVDQESPGNATGYFARVDSDERIEFARCARVKMDLEGPGK